MWRLRCAGRASGNARRRLCVNAAKAGDRAGTCASHTFIETRRSCPKHVAFRCRQKTPGRPRVHTVTCTTTRKRKFIPQDTYHGCERLERFCFRGLWEVREMFRRPLFLAYSLSAPTADSVGILRHEPAENGQQHPRWVQPGASRAERTHIHLLCGCEELFSARPAYALQHG